MYLIKTTGSHGIESCGFATNSHEEMENYCSQVMASMGSTVNRISVYESSEQCVNVSYNPRFGLSAHGKNMLLVKEIKVGEKPKVKHK